MRKWLLWLPFTKKFVNFIRTRYALCLASIGYRFMSRRHNNNWKFNKFESYCYRNEILLNGMNESAWLISESVAPKPIPFFIDSHRLHQSPTIRIRMSLDYAICSICFCAAVVCSFIWRQFAKRNECTASIASLYRAGIWRLEQMKCFGFRFGIYIPLWCRAMSVTHFHLLVCRENIISDLIYSEWYVCVFQLNTSNCQMRLLLHSFLIHHRIWHQKRNESNSPTGGNSNRNRRNIFDRR